MPPALESSFPDTGQPIPDTAHVAHSRPQDPGTELTSAQAVSVSLPSWRANLGYEEGEEWVHSKMRSGYPRFYIHPTIQAFADAVVAQSNRRGDRALLFPSTRVAMQCREFLLRQQASTDPRSQSCDAKHGDRYAIAELVLPEALRPDRLLTSAIVAAVVFFFPKLQAPAASKFWQHTGEGISSRRAEFFYPIFLNGDLKVRWLNAGDVSDQHTVCKGPRRYQKCGTGDSRGQAATPDEHSSDLLPTQGKTAIAEDLQYIEERFGRNLNARHALDAKQAIQRRIAGALFTYPSEPRTPTSKDNNADRHVAGESEVFLFPTGMSAIFNAHRMVLDAVGYAKCVMYGFPYIDTLKILENFGLGCVFYGQGDATELSDLEFRLQRNEKFAAVFCEFPGNPLLKTPDLARIRRLADTYGFAVVVDETIGNFMNVNVLPWADVVVSSLTKVFSGDSNVMGGSCILNKKSKMYGSFRAFMNSEYEDNYWLEDAVFMERNSRDFVSRNHRINQNAAALSQVLRASRFVKALYYPLFSPTQRFFDACRTHQGGYGGLLSITFHSTQHAISFFDSLETAKGPSLGTNFTLSCPFVILAHYHELEWAATYGVEADLVRISVGVEDTEELCGIFQRALDVLEI